MILNGDSKQYVVSDFPCILGRSPQEATIVLDDSGVSRKHAVIDLDNNQIFITDINSRNGVFLNKSRIKPETAQEIASGDTIKIGRVEIRIE